MAGTDQALIDALGSEVVQQAFRSLGVDPVLMITPETDGSEDRALAAFEALNRGRDDATVRDARIFLARRIAQVTTPQ